ncbi:MAG: hypothetical protein AAFY47_07710 [Pseudomonadota bacterium]
MSLADWGLGRGGVGLPEQTIHITQSRKIGPYFARTCVWNGAMIDTRMVAAEPVLSIGIDTVSI